MESVELTVWNKFNFKDYVISEHPDVFVNIGKDIARVGFSTRFNNDSGYFLSGTNLIYYETDLVEREPRSDETHPFSHIRDNKEERHIYSVEIPPIEKLRTAVKNHNIDAYDGLTTCITDSEARDKIVKEFQKEIEHWNFYSIKLGRHGFVDESLQSEWNPNKSEKSRELLHEMASMKFDSALSHWETALTIPYRYFFKARTRLLGLKEPKLGIYKRVALDVAGANGQEYCQHCGGIQSKEEFLYVTINIRNKSNRTKRVCDGCATLYDDYPEKDVEKAREERVNRIGGQSTLSGY